MKTLVFLLVAVGAPAESLHYTISWPSGISLGEATLVSDHQDDRWAFELNLDAGVPGFSVHDHDQASASADFCSARLDRNHTHGRRKTEEVITFDQQNNTFTRGSVNGEGVESSAPACARDALTFLQFARQELAQGRLAPQQLIVFGATYQVRLEATGQQMIRSAERQIEADRILATIKGPASDLTVEIFFARDAARTPLLARVPVPLGTFTVELIR